MKKKVAAFLAATSLMVGAMPVVTNAEPVRIVSSSVTEQSASGYRVSVTFSSDLGISRVMMPTWTEKDGQDDLVWHQASVSGNTASFYVPVSAHKNESGKYITHIYVYDTKGQFALKGETVTVPAPQTPSTPAQSLSVGDVSVTEVSASGYRVTAKLNAPSGVSKVLMPTWTTKNGQDDLVWHEASVSGDTATFYVSSSAHKGESGAYTTHIYLYDKTGALAPLKGVDVTVPAAQTPSTPVQSLSIGDVSVTEVSASGYRVTAKLNAPSGVSKVLMPTWTTKNGQDDLVWHEASVSGDTATFYVSSSTHKGESGAYTTHIYLYDKTGALAPLKGVDVTVPASQTPSTPVQSLSVGDVSVTEVSASGYRVTAKLNAPSGVSKVLMPTWTTKNGQDDLVWHEASVSGDTATFYVSSSAHKGESGAYTTHIYLYDKTGALAPLKGVDVTVPASSGGSGNSGNAGGSGSGTGVLSMEIPYVTELSANGFRVTIRFNAPVGYTRVATAVWTSANGQDDLVWHDMAVSGNMATCYVPAGAHNNEHGSYIVNAYVFESSSKYVLQGMIVPVP